MTGVEVPVATVLHRYRQEQKTVRQQATTLMLDADLAEVYGVTTSRVNELEAQFVAQGDKIQGILEVIRSFGGTTAIRLGLKGRIKVELSRSRSSR